VKFTADHVLELERSAEELEQRRQWNAASKTLRRRNKTQIREERERERRKQEERRGKDFGVAAMPAFLEPPAQQKRKKNRMNLSIETKNGTPWDESSESDELQEVAQAALAQHSESHPGRRTPAVSPHHGRRSPALEVAVRNSDSGSGSSSGSSSGGSGNSSGSGVSAPFPLRSPSILKPESPTHNWQRSTVWAGGIPEAFATEQTVSLMFHAAFGSVVSVTVQRKTTEEHGPCRSWAFVTFAEPHAAARARLAGELRVLPEAAQQLLPDVPAAGTHEAAAATTTTSTAGVVSEQEQGQGDGHGGVVLQLKEAKIPEELEQRRKLSRQQRQQRHNSRATSQAEASHRVDFECEEEGQESVAVESCDSPLICGTDVPPCSALARMWAEQQEKLERSNAIACRDSSTDSPTVLLQLHWSPKGFASPVDSLLDELVGTPTGLVPLLFRSSQAARAPPSPCRRHRQQHMDAGVLLDQNGALLAQPGEDVQSV